ncbi:MAG: cation:proton antiporter [Treponema sp.]|nr:cation:proton antiporter [Treponema sp.]
MTRNHSSLFRFSIYALLLLAGGFVCAEGDVTESMTNLVLQIAVILFAVRVFGKAAERIGIPSVLGELISGVIIGPYALGGIPLPGFPHGFFPLNSADLAVSPELYGFSTIASIILLFASGLETDFALFLKYSLTGSIVGLGGVVFSFVFGDITGVLLLGKSFSDPLCLFLGIMSTATSVGITARILSAQKKMDSPEGVTILAAAVFDDVLGIVLLAVVLGIVAVLQGGGSVSAGAISLIAARAFGIWLGFTALGLIFSKRIAAFLKLFKHSWDFSICALGLALLLAGFFEKQGLAMIIGAYVTGLSLSGTDIANVVQERMYGLYEFFVPLFFAVMGMMVNVRALFSAEVLGFGLCYTVLAVVSKVMGCGIPTLAMGFNLRGALRIGSGMVPRGEVALIIAGIGLTAGILDEQMFGVVILMTLLTTLAAPPLLTASLKMNGRGTRKETKIGDSETITWDFGTAEIAGMVNHGLLRDLRSEGFFVQSLNMDEGISHARKDDFALSITKKENIITIEASQEEAGFIKTTMYENVLRLNEAMQDLKDASDPLQLKKDSFDGVIHNCALHADKHLVKKIKARAISVDLQGNTKDEILKELVQLLANTGHVTNFAQVLHDVDEREKVMSTGMQNGIALPHAKTDGVDGLCCAIGIKKTGADFGAMDGKPSTIFILVASPKVEKSPHLQFLAFITSILKNEGKRARIAEAPDAATVKDILINEL